MTTQPPSDLSEIRQRLDVVDKLLVEVLLERSKLIEEVIHFKRAHGMAVIDAFTLLEVEHLGPDS